MIIRHLIESEDNKMAKGKKYAEPEGYFPKDLRKKYSLGEYAKDKAKAVILYRTPKARFKI